MITIWQDGNQMFAKDSTDNIVGTARCSSGDSRYCSVMQAVKHLFDNKEIKVGDCVKVINTGELYSTNDGWVAKNISDARLVARYAYGDNMGYPKKTESDAEFEVRFIDYKTNKVYIEKSEDDNACYLIDIAGLERWTEK